MSSFIQRVSFKLSIEEQLEPRQQLRKNNCADNGKSEKVVSPSSLMLVAIFLEEPNGLLHFSGGAPKQWCALALRHYSIAAHYHC